MTNDFTELSEGDVWHDRHSGTFRVTVDSSDTESLTVSIVLAIATIKEVEPTELDSLSVYVDTDALDTLFDTEPTNRSAIEGSFSFTYEGFCVLVNRNGELVISPVDSSSENTED